MKHTSAAAVFAALLTASSALAQGFDGASILLENNDSVDRDYSVASVEGRLSYGLGGGFGVQVDAYAMTYDDGDSGHGLALHGYYAVNSDLTVGVFAGRDDWEWLRSGARFFGLEALYETDAWSLEAYVGRYSVANNPDETYFGVLTSYEMTDSLEVLASTEAWNYARFGGGTWGHYTIGARYSLNNGAFFEGRVGQLRDGNYTRNLVSLTLGFDLGGGAVFTRRDYMAITDGW
ncbi:hypothetical protein HKCCSP123_06085 [Rhodobacterales bacterium HKCCSP123]|nr:hypothetical protein [Rhodobacterales bacterium HKCCSP123]